MDQHNITPVENSLNLYHLKDNKNNGLSPVYDFKTKGNHTPFLSQFPWEDLILLIPNSVEDISIDHTQTYKELPSVFVGRGEVKGRKFTQIESSSKAYLYQVQSNGSIYWEVFKRRQNLRFGNVMYPSSHAFGRWAWTTFSLERAKQIFNTKSKGGR